MGLANPGQTQPLPALQVGLRDGLQRLLRLNKEGRNGARLRAEVLEQRGPAEKLPVVHREPREVRAVIRRLAPRALETGRHRAAQAFFLTFEAPKEGCFRLFGRIFW